MKLNRSDYWLAKFSFKFSRLLNRLSRIENQWISSHILDKEIDRPIFITGLARSGTTILLELISQTPSVGTHRYSDFPFVATPWLWHRFRQRLGTKPPSLPIERPHQDKIQITPESPESMEEPLWQSWFPWIHSADNVHELPSITINADFARFYCEHINKILLIRQASRYASKNNYHVTRIEYLNQLFPDARFIIPVRHPISHVASLMRQHELFSSYCKTDPRIQNYLQYAGHYEFGPQRVPIQLQQDSTEQLKAAVKNQKNNEFYAIQWRDIYRRVFDLYHQSTDFRNRTVIVRHEDFCLSPYKIWQNITMSCELEDTRTDFRHILPPQHTPLLDSHQASEVWSVTQSVANDFGYESTLSA